MSQRRADEITDEELERGVAALVRELGESKAQAFVRAAANRGTQKAMAGLASSAILGAVKWAQSNPRAAAVGAVVAAVGGVGVHLASRDPAHVRPRGIPVVPEQRFSALAGPPGPPTPRVSAGSSAPLARRGYVEVDGVIDVPGVDVTRR